MTTLRSRSRSHRNPRSRSRSRNRHPRKTRSRSRSRTLYLPTPQPCFPRPLAAVVRTLLAETITLLLWGSFVRILTVIVSGLLRPLANPLLNAVIGVGAGLLLPTRARVFRIRSHVPVQLRSAVVCHSTGRCGAIRVRILG